MKSQIVLTVLAALTSTVVYAQVPGALELHSFSCQSTTHELGVDYKLDVETQALNPTGDIRSIILLKQVVAPGAPQQQETLQQASQDISSATFVGSEVVVILDKSSMKAKLEVGTNEFICAE